MKDLTSFRPDKKQRVTMFIDPKIVRQAKAQSALEAKTLSELTEQMFTEQDLMSMLEKDSLAKSQRQTNAGWINLYGFDLNKTPRAEWYERLSDECKKRGLI